MNSKKDITYLTPPSHLMRGIFFTLAFYLFPKNRYSKRQGAEGRRQKAEGMHIDGSWFQYLALF
jgi:hypothetical protein